jgi:hypothetical protein
MSHLTLTCHPSKSDEEKRVHMKHEFFVCLYELTSVDDKNTECYCKPKGKRCPNRCSTSNSESTVLLVGLRVNPRKEEHRNNMNRMPSVKFCEGLDVVSRKAYNDGATRKEVINKNRDTDYNYTILAGSLSQSIINSPFVLYISAEHWASAKKYVPAMYSLIVTGVNNKFTENQILMVTPYLMNQVLLSFARMSTSRELKRPLSQRAIYMYYQVFRVFYEMSKQYPTVIQQAISMLGKFIREPESRTVDKVPYLDSLLPILLISSKYSWDELKQPFIQEFWRRAAFKHPYERGNDSDILDMQSRVKHLFHQTMNKCRSLALGKAFLDGIFRPKGKSLNQVIGEIDNVYGYIEDDVVDTLLDVFRNDIQTMNTMDKFMDMMGFTSTKKELEEMVDWAYQFADFEKQSKQICNAHIVHKTMLEDTAPIVKPVIRYKNIKTVQEKQGERHKHVGFPKHMFKNSCGFCMQKFASRNELFSHLKDMTIDTTENPVFKIRHYRPCTGGCEHASLCTCHLILREVPIEVNEKAILAAAKKKIGARKQK